MSSIRCLTADFLPPIPSVMLDTGRTVFTKFRNIPINYNLPSLFGLPMNGYREGALLLKFARFATPHPSLRP